LTQLLDSCSGGPLPRSLPDHVRALVSMHRNRELSVNVAAGRDSPLLTRYVSGLRSAGVWDRVRGVLGIDPDLRVGQGRLASAAARAFGVVWDEDPGLLTLGRDAAIRWVVSARGPVVVPPRWGRVVRNAVSRLTELPGLRLSEGHARQLAVDHAVMWHAAGMKKTGSTARVVAALEGWGRGLYLSRREASLAQGLSVTLLDSTLSRFEGSVPLWGAVLQLGPVLDVLPRVVEVLRADEGFAGSGRDPVWVAGEVSARLLDSVVRRDMYQLLPSYVRAFFAMRDPKRSDRQIALEEKIPTFQSTVRRMRGSGLLGEVLGLLGVAPSAHAWPH
jgi:hypothetical protein